MVRLERRSVKKALCALQASPYPASKKKPGMTASDALLRKHANCGLHTKNGNRQEATTASIKLRRV